MADATRRSIIAGAAVAGMGLLAASRTEAKVIEPKTLTENLMYTTARIVGINAAGGQFKTGTGFFYQIPLPGSSDQSVPMLVTNKHVIKDTTHVDFTIHTSAVMGAAKPDGKHQLRSEAANWVPHPDPKIDLCAVPVGASINQVKGFFRALQPSDLPTEAQLEELSAVEEILMVGYPRGLWDATNNYPLIRRGITASHPAVDHLVDGVPTIVIDAACFPGSSGSPVVLHSVGGYAPKSGGIALASRTMFLGVLYSGPIYTQDGKIVVRNIPTGNEPIPQIDLMMNLGYIVKARELAALCDAVMVKYQIAAPIK